MKQSQPMVLMVALLAACSGKPDAEAPTRGPEKPQVAAVDHQRMLQADSEPGNWMGPGRNYFEQRFSPLDQINDQNVGKLGLAWYFDLKTHRGVEGTPLVIDGVMYTNSTWNITYALDAKTGKQLWRYDPQVDKSRGRVMCCDAVSRGLSAWNGKIIIATIDGRVIALDAKTGTPIWSVQSFEDMSWAYSITGAPRVFDGKVIIGNAGAEFGVRGYTTAYDVETGKQLWRFYSVPGDPSKGFEDEAMEMAAKTWKGEWWKYGGGGTAWDSFGYDPELDLVYIGTGNAFPWVQDYRSPGGGDNLFLCSIVAVKADTGEYVWHYQQAPGEQWDYTATQPIILADLTIDGKPRKVLMQAPKNGFFYILDRATGELISAEKYVPTNLWATHIDMKTGRPVLTKEAMYGTKPVLLTPAVAGGHNWQPMAYSPRTGLVYFPAQEHWWVYSKDPRWDGAKPRQLRNDMGMGGPMDPERIALMKEADSREKGWLMAWDPVKGKEVWRVQHEHAGSGGVLVTAGNLVAEGTRALKFVIHRADTGELLWEMPVQTVPVAGPISYMVDGEQYIAVNAGWGGGMAMGELRAGKAFNRADARVLAFKLGGTATLPPLPERQPLALPPPSRGDDAAIAKGADLYEKKCAMCHGREVRGGGVIKDLRYMSPQTHQAFNDIVLKGLLVGQGMSSFADELTVEETEAIHAYINARAFDDWGEPR
jgi:quinohemoprotein ethanol dehydrogenase